MDIEIGDILKLKKEHPCKNKEFLVLRAGMDFRLRCLGCSREFWVPRNKLERSIIKVTKEAKPDKIP